MTAFKQSCQFWRASKFTAWIVASSWLLALGDQPNATPSHLLPPSVIFLLLDDLGFNNVPWNEGSVARMPHTEALYRMPGSVTLTAHHAQRWCAPTRASLLTGRYPFRIGWNQYGVSIAEERSAVPIDFMFLPKILKERAPVPYRTAMVGKYHLGFFKQRYTPCGRGFDSYFGFLLGSATHDTHNSWGKHTCGIPIPDLYNCTGPANESLHYQNMTYSAEMYGEVASDILHQHALLYPQQPLFLYLAFQTNHEPYSAPEDYLHEFAHFAEKGSRRTYNAMNLAMDRAIGKVLAAIDAHKDVYLDPVIVFTSDNGGPVQYANNLPLRGGKFGLFEGSTRTNAFIHSRRLASRGTAAYTGLFHISDWYPTIADMAGIVNLSSTGPDGFSLPDGMSHWASLLDSRRAPPRSEVVHELDFKKNLVSLRRGSFKMLYGSVGVSDWVADVDHPCRACCPFRRPPLPMHPRGHECAAQVDAAAVDDRGSEVLEKMCTATAPCLYNIELDPEERLNLFGNVSYASIITEMHERISFWKALAYTKKLDEASVSQSTYCENIKRIGWVVPYDDDSQNALIV